MNPVLKQAKQNMKKQFNKIKKEMVDYELYKEFYDFMKCSPMMQTVIKENRELKMFNKILLETVDELKKKLRMKEFANVKVKKEKVDEVVDLTHEIESVSDSYVETEPNIVYELVEEHVEYKKDTSVEEGEIVEEEEEEAEEVELEEEEQEVEEEEVELEEEEAELEVEEEEVEVEVEEEEVEVEVEEVEEEEEVEVEVEEVEEEADEEEEVEEEVEVEEEEEVEVEEAEEEEVEVEVEEAEEEEVEEEAEEEAEEEEVYEITIKSKTYYVTNEKNGTIYSVTSDGDIGDEVGKYVDGKPVFK
jgi:hypothetical protein